MRLVPVVFTIALLLGALACKKDKDIIDEKGSLAFSDDSLFFDTVFTTVGSTTKWFIVKNPGNKTLKISKIRIARAAASFFRMNVDGTPGNEIFNVEIKGKDSLFIFVEVTVDPTNQNNPLVIRDSIEFHINGKMQDVKLEAWGQDAYYHKPTVFPINGFPPYSIIKCDETWTNDKPHVIYGYAVVDSACKLTMMPGTRVHLHNKAVLWVYAFGSLDIKGSKSDPVIIQGDRLEPEYSEVPGQWGKIWLSALSKTNTIDWAIIKNGSIGIQADTVYSWASPTLKISNSVIRNMTGAALFAQGSYIRGYNNLFANCKQYVAALTIGGMYSFIHCTFANYWTEGTRQTPLLLLNNYYTDIYNTTHVRHLDSAWFGNCIIYGSQENELELDSSSYGGNFRFFFDHSAIRIDPKLNSSSAYHYNSIIKNSDPVFLNAGQNDYSLSASSPLINKGDVAIGAKYPEDIKGNSRTADAAPDPGAYEYKP